MGTTNHRSIGNKLPRRHLGDASTHAALTHLAKVLIFLPILVLVALVCDAVALFPERGLSESISPSVKARANFGDTLLFVGFRQCQSFIVGVYAQNLGTVPPPSADLVADLYLSLQLSQTGSFVYVLSANKSDAERAQSPVPTVSQVLTSPISLLWENIRQRVQVIRVHITTVSSGIGPSSRWNSTQIAIDTTRTVWSLNSTSDETKINSGSSDNAASLYTEHPRITDLSYFLGQDGIGEGFTPDRAFPQGSPFRVACPNSNNSSPPQQIRVTSGDPLSSQEVFLDSNPRSISSLAGPRRLIRSDPSVYTYDPSASNLNASGITDDSCENTTVLIIAIGPKSNFRLWHLDAAGSLLIPLRWIDNVQRFITTADDDATSTSSSSSSSFLTVPLSFSTQIPSAIKQNTMFALCCAVGVASVITGGGGWIGLTSLQTLLVSVGGPNHCTEPFTDYYFANVYTILVAPTTLAKQSIESNQALTVGIIGLSILVHVGLATIKKKLSNVSFWSAARSCYFPMPFLIAVTYLWIRLNSETFIGVAGTDQTPLIRVSFALSWLIVFCVTVYVWYDALVTGHDGYYVLTQLPTSLEKTALGAKVKDLGTQQSSSELLNAKLAEQIIIDDLERSVSVHDDQKQSTGIRHAHRDHQHDEVELRHIPGNTHKSYKELLSRKSERQNKINNTSHYDRIGRPKASTKREGGKSTKYNSLSNRSPQVGVVPAAAQQHLLKVESLVVRVSYGLLGRFAWFIIPEGSWPLTRGYGVCRGLFRDASCSFAIFTLFFLCVIAAVSNSASCEALYLNSAIVQSIYLLLFLVFLPFRIPLLNLLWVVIKVSEITVNACLYYFLQHNFDGGVTDVIPALATVVTGLNAAFVFYACLVTFSERSARNSEKLKLIISKGVGHTGGPHKYVTGDGGDTSNLADLDKEPRSDPNFLSLVEHYRSFAAR